MYLLFQSVATAVVLLLIPPLCSQTPTWHAGMARVTVRDDLGTAPGSAFVIAFKSGAAYLLTAAHVVAGDPTPKVTFQVDSSRTPYLARIAFNEGATNENGLAVLVVANPPSGVRALIESTNEISTAGTKVDVGGFPASLDSFFPFEASATRSGSDLILSQRTDKGYSGGPIIREGAVEGLIYGRGEFGRAIQSANLRTFLEGNGVLWDEEPRVKFYTSDSTHDKYYITQSKFGSIGYVGFEIGCNTRRYQQFTILDVMVTPPNGVATSIGNGRGHCSYDDVIVGQFSPTRPGIYVLSRKDSGAVIGKVSLIP